MRRLLLSTVMCAGLIAGCSGSPDVEASSPETQMDDTQQMASSETARSAEQIIVDEARQCAVGEDAEIRFAAAPDGPRDAAANLAASTAYLDEIRGEACVFELPSGLLFRVRRASEDGFTAEPGDMITAHYRGLHIWGEEFDSSYSRGQPMQYPSNQFIAGWNEALTLMRTGEIWELYIPSDLGYGARGTPGGPIGADQALVFQMELIATLESLAAAGPTPEQIMVEEARACIVGDDVEIRFDAAPAEARDAAANQAASAAYLDVIRQEECVHELPSGLLFRIRQASEDGDTPNPGDMITAHYRGLHIWGEEFDSSYSRSQPMQYPSNRFIAGWNEALTLMRTGEIWELYIPSNLGYGPRGTPGGPIGPDQALVFQMELISTP